MGRPLRAQQDRGASSSLCIPVSQSSSAQNGQEDVKMDPVQRISGVSDSDTEYGSIKREKGGLYWSCHQCGQKGMTPKQLREHVRTSTGCHASHAEPTARMQNNFSNTT